jgi:hypothetical protein
MREDAAIIVRQHTPAFHALAVIIAPPSGTL